MELGDAAVVRLPAQLSVASVAALERDLRAALDAAAGRVVVLCGADETTFCTGLALGGEGPVDTETFAALLAALADAPKPTLAVVGGEAIGGGLGLASACDWVVASERAVFALPELLWGLVPAMIWPLVAARATEGVARRWTVSGRSRTAREALADGVVDEVAAAGREDAAAARAVRMLLRLEPGALQEMRRWSRESRACPLPEALQRGASLTARMAGSPMVRDRVAAFRRGDVPWN